MTYREARYISERIAGKDKTHAALAAGFSYWVSRNAGQQLESPEILAKIQEMQSELVQFALDHSLIDAAETHERLTAEIRGDIAELYNPSDPTDQRFNPAFSGGALLPISLWPMWARNGGVKVFDEPNMVHSDDDGGGSWDQKGRRIRIEMSPRTKSIELAMKHKAVNAMVEAKSPDVHLHLHAQIVRNLQGALARDKKLIESK